MSAQSKKTTTFRQILLYLHLRIPLFLFLLALPSSFLSHTTAANSTTSVPKVSLTKEERAWLKMHPVVRLAPDPEFAPIEFFDHNGTYQGVAADMIKLLENKLGFSFTIAKERDWDEVMEKFKAGDIDTLGAIVPTPNRKTFMRISNPLLKVPGAIMVRKNVDTPLTIEKLKGMKVAVVSNYTAHNIMSREYPGIDLDIVKNTTNGLTKVSFGMVDAFVENLATSTYYLQEAAISNVHVAGDTPFIYQWGIGIRQDWPILERIINKGIDTITQEERRVILNRWLPAEQPLAMSRNQKIALAGLLTFLGIAGVFLWNLSLRKKVKAKTEALSKIILEQQAAEEEIRLLNTNLEQRVAERTADLLKSEERMHLALSAADIAIWDWNILTGETYFSPCYFTMLGYEANELPSTYETWLALLHDDDRERAAAEIKRCQEHQKSWDIEFRLRTKQADYRWIRGRGNVVEADADGKLIRASGTHLDITSEKQAAEVLRKSENTLKSILVAVPVGIGLVHNRMFSWVSERIVEMTGYTSHELIGKSARLLYLSEEEFLRVGNIKYGQLETATVGVVDTVWKKKSGELLNIHLQSSPIDPKNLSLGITFSALDITEKVKHEENVRRLERQILQTKNLESLGVLAGGIAHDFNNILMAVLGNISLAALSLPPESKEASLMRESEKACLRAKDLTRQLLTFSKGGEPIRETSSVAGVIVDSANFVLRGSPVACEFDIPDDLWLVDIDKGQISQVIQNLIINAKNAMPEGGTITVSCRNIDNIRNENTPLSENNKYIKITVTDTGVGIPATVLDKIFEPYFTTKPHGSGLGLALTFSIIVRHHGHVTAKSEVGVGSSFFIYLPASDKGLSLPADTESDPPTQVKKLRVMVMDDEEMVRDIAESMLTNLGHQVILAENGTEAVQLFREAKEPIDLVIMDLTIPGGMGGKEAVQGILALDSTAKVLVSSGYSEDPVMANFRDYGFSGAMVKPYTLEELSQTINKFEI